MSEDDDEDKKALARQIERFGDAHRTAMVSSIQHLLWTIAEAAAKIAQPHVDDAWAKEWTEMVRRAAADLRSAGDRVQLQPYAPHGEVPS